MKILIAPDSFKGSLTANEAADAMTIAVRASFPEAEIVSLPLADGGEGTVEALHAASPGSRRVPCSVMGPLGSVIQAEYLLMAPDFTTAVIEMAQAAGLLLVPAHLRNPLDTTTYGVGQMLAEAIAVGAQRCIIGLGGSATNDGGAGALQVLGVTLLGHDGAPVKSSLPMLGSDVGQIAAIHAPSRSEWDECEILIASDVTNSLTGPNGASVIFGPQKGATKEIVERLDSDLAAYGVLLDAFARQRGRATGVSELPGAGAAGGLGAALLAYFPHAVIRRGIDVVLEAIALDAHLEDADLVLTGEGKLDAQTLSGKAVQGILQAAHRRGVTVLAVAGIIADGAADVLKMQGLHEAYALMDLASSQEDAVQNAAHYLQKSVRLALAQMSFTA